MLNRPNAIATNRFGLGARPGDNAHIGDDPRGWLESQLAQAPAAQTGSREPESARVLQQVTELRLARQIAQSAINQQAPEIDRTAVREYARFIADAYQRQAARGLTEAIATDRPLHERLVRFWANHFAVSADKQPVGAIAGLYRDEALAPNITGNFRDLLIAATRHPAMLLYLDNQTSIGPSSIVATLANRNPSRNRRTGLNENLGREILELHTLGVDGGYSQDDVIELSRALTGWSIAGTGDQIDAAAARLAGRRPRAARLGEALSSSDAGEPGQFTFREAVHEPGARTLLGKRFADAGVEQAEAMLAYLTVQPATARFLAAKLARHFVADEPPEALVESLARIYLDNDGELVPVYRALIRSEASWQSALTKYKAPQEFLISSWRALGQNARETDAAAPDVRGRDRAQRTDPGTAAMATPSRPAALVAASTQLGQRPLTPGSPAGWPDIAAQWNSGDALLKRIDWTTAVGATIGDRIDATATLDEVLGDVASAATRSGVARAESGSQAVALLLSAPEFQRR